MRPAMRRARGFTLIELAVVAIIVSIVAAAIAPLALSSLRAYDGTLSNLIVLDKLRYATERLVREMREVNYDPSSGSFAFTSMSATAPVFTRSFYDSGGNITTATVTVGNTIPTVTLAYSTLSGTGAQVLTDEVGSLTFAYYDKNGGSTTSIVNVRYVEISLTLTHNGQSYNQRTRVQLKGII